MRIEIDQSGKIECTNKATVLAFSNSKNHSIIILSRDKKYLQKIFRRAGNPKIFIYKTFAVMIFYLIRNYLKQIDQIIIDKEYMGYEKLIRKLFLEICLKNRIKIKSDIINFRQIGKKSNAHLIAIKAYRKKKANSKITIKDFLKVAL